MPATRHLARLAERGVEEFRSALGSLAGAAQSGTSMATALVSRIDGDRYHVLAIATEDEIGIHPGDIHPLAHTLCSRVASAGEAVALPDARRSDPRAALLGIGAYAAVPLRRITGDLYGTLAIIDPDQRDALDGEVSFLWRLSRLAAHEIALYDNLQRLVDEASSDQPAAAGEALDPAGDLRGLTTLITAALRQTAPHDEPRLRAMLARETNRFAHDLLDTVMRHRHLALLPGNAEPWGTPVDELLDRGGALLPGGQGSRIRINAHSGAVADIPRRHLERILVNIVYRAWRVAPPPSPITITSKVRPGAVEIVVEDVGPSVPAEEAGALFEQPGPGLLGLSVVRELVTAAGGAVRYEREMSTNRIIVRLPLAGAPRLAPLGLVGSS